MVSEDYFDNTEPNYVGYTLEGDKVKGTYEGINYGQPEPTVPGFDYTDYDTSTYASMTTTLPASGDTVKEYFPHAPGDYTQPANGSSTELNRQMYENETFTDKRLPAGRNSLFKDCTFEGVFYIGIGGNANIDGTILSMYYPGPLGSVAAQYGTNVGFSDENIEAGIPEDVGTIHIHPDSQNPQNS